MPSRSSNAQRGRCNRRRMKLRMQAIVCIRGRHVIAVAPLVWYDVSHSAHNFANIVPQTHTSPSHPHTHQSFGAHPASSSIPYLSSANTQPAKNDPFERGNPPGYRASGSDGGGHICLRPRNRLRFRPGFVPDSAGEAHYSSCISLRHTTPATVSRHSDMDLVR